MTDNYTWALEGLESSSSQPQSCLEYETALALGRAGRTSRSRQGYIGAIENADDGKAEPDAKLWS